MTVNDLGGVLRWNANFVRGLAQSVLERARTIRGSLPGGAPVEMAAVAKKTIKPAVKKPKVTKVTKKPGRKKRK